MNNTTTASSAPANGSVQLAIAPAMVAAIPNLLAFAQSAPTVMALAERYKLSLAVMIGNVLSDTTTNYAKHAASSGWPPHGWRDPKYSKLLGDVLHDTYKRFGFALPAVVVNQKTGEPGDSFFIALEPASGIPIKRLATGAMDPADMRVRWNAELVKMGMSPR